MGILLRYATCRDCGADDADLSDGGEPLCIACFAARFHDRRAQLRDMLDVLGVDIERLGREIEAVLATTYAEPDGPPTEEIRSPLLCGDKPTP